MPLRNNTDIEVFQRHTLNDPRYGILYDPLQREYYNSRLDIFLSEDDISFYKLRPYDKITSPLPNPLPVDYFVKF